MTEQNDESLIALLDEKPPGLRGNI